MHKHKESIRICLKPITKRIDSYVYQEKGELYVDLVIDIINQMGVEQMWDNSKIVNFNGIEYVLDDSLWEKHVAMHPNRSEEALQSNLFICLNNKKNVCTKDIEKVIEDEYYIHSHMDEIIAEAEDLLCIR